jgi:transcription initiation factor IIE alpha subunit
MDDVELPACPDCGNPLEYAAKLASIERITSACLDVAAAIVPTGSPSMAP